MIRLRLPCSEPAENGTDTVGDGPRASLGTPHLNAAFPEQTL